MIQRSDVDRNVKSCELRKADRAPPGVGPILVVFRFSALISVIPLRISNCAVKERPPRTHYCHNYN